MFLSHVELVTLVYISLHFLLPSLLPPPFLPSLPSPLFLPLSSSSTLLFFPSLPPSLFLPFPFFPPTVMVENLSVFLYSRDRVVDLVLLLHTSLTHSLASYCTMPPTLWRSTTKNLKQCSNSQPSISNDFRFSVLSSSVLASDRQSSLAPHWDHH